MNVDGYNSSRRRLNKRMECVNYDNGKKGEDYNITTTNGAVRKKRHNVLTTKRGIRAGQ